MHKDIHTHEFIHNNQKMPTRQGKILTVRAISGLSGDIILTGLSALSGTNTVQLNELLLRLNIPNLENCLEITTKYVNAIQGLHTKINLPHDHSHRTFKDIVEIIEKSDLSLEAKGLSIACFDLLAEAEGKIHGKEKQTVTFHEVGALDSIIDICLSCALFDKINPDYFVSSPLPLADGSIHCAHGHIPSPAPAVFELLNNVAVVPFAGQGETITPTAIALLKVFNAEFGSWPQMHIGKTAIAYGTKVFPNVANGSLWALGQA